MKKCKLCGGACYSIGGGEYQCDCCGNIFGEEDLINVKERAQIEAAKTRAAEEVRAKADIEKAKIKANASVNRGADLYDNCIDGVLEISCRGKQGSWSGSGYIISRYGYAVTNAHVAADSDGYGCNDIKVRVCGQNVRAKVVVLADDKAGHGSGVDLAIIQLERMPSGAKALPMGDSDALRTGEQIYVIGNSLGYGTCITGGIVSDRYRNGYIMYDCATNPGNSGGPVFNAKGEVIGTHAAGQRGDNGAKVQGMNYAIPISVVKTIVGKMDLRL